MDFISPSCSSLPLSHFTDIGFAFVWTKCIAKSKSPRQLACFHAPTPTHTHICDSILIKMPRIGTWRRRREYRNDVNMVRQCIDVNDNAKLNVVHLVSQHFENIFIPLWCGWFVYEVGYCNDFSNIGKSDLNIQMSERIRHVKDDAKWIFPTLLLVQTPQREVIKWQKSVRKIKFAQQQTDELVCVFVTFPLWTFVSVAVMCRFFEFYFQTAWGDTVTWYIIVLVRSVSLCVRSGWKSWKTEKKTLKSSQMQSPRKHLRISFRLPTR